MKMTMSILALGTLLCGVLQGRAETINYTVQGTATGTLGAVGFTNAPVTVTFIGDTSKVTQNFPHFWSVVGTATVTIGGIGTATITEPMDAFCNQDFPAAGIGKAPGSSADQYQSSLLDIIDPTLTSWDLRSATGPINNRTYYTPGVSYATNLGALIFNNVSDTSTFTATIVPPPPPPAPRNLIVLLPNENGAGGSSIVVTNAGSSQQLKDANSAINVERADSAPSKAFAMDPSEIQRLFHDTLSLLPTPEARFNLYFLAGRTGLNAESRAILPNIYEAYKERHSTDVSIIGHTDTTGDEKSNFRPNFYRFGWTKRSPGSDTAQSPGAQKPSR